MLKARLFGSVIAIGAALYTPTAFSQSSQEELLDLADDAGTVAASFQVCSKRQVARSIRTKVRQIASECTDDQDGKADVLDEYNDSFADTLDDVSSPPTFCKQQSSRKVNNLMNSLDDALDNC